LSTLPTANRTCSSYAAAANSSTNGPYLTSAKVAAELQSESQAVQALWS